MAWLDELLEATSEAESPRSFIMWAGLAAIAGVMKSHVFLDKFYYKLYPNVYIMLVAKSGMRKGFPIKIAESLVSAADTTRVISGRNSIQGIIKSLSTAFTKPSGGPPITDAAGFLVSGEFSNFIIDDPASLTILTELYDGHYVNKWENTLKGSGTETLKNVCLTLLGASNQTHLRDRIAEKDITGGFIGRTIIVLEEKKHLINPLTKKPEKEFNLEKLSLYLKEIAKLRGEFKYSPHGMKCYEDWYNDFSAKEHEDKTGASERIHDNVLKVAMLMSLARRTSLILEEEDIQGAIDACISHSVSMQKVTMGSGRSDLGPLMGKVLQEMLAQPDHKITRIKLLQKYYGDFDAATLDRMMDTLIQGKYVDTEFIGGKLTYILDPKVVEQYQQIKGRGQR